MPIGSTFQHNAVHVPSRLLQCCAEVICRQLGFYFGGMAGPPATDETSWLSLVYKITDGSENCVGLNQYYFTASPIDTHHCQHRLETCMLHLQAVCTSAIIAHGHGAILLATMSAHISRFVKEKNGSSQLRTCSLGFLALMQNPCFRIAGDLNGTMSIGLSGIWVVLEVWCPVLCKQDEKCADWYSRPANMKLDATGCPVLRSLLPHNPFCFVCTASWR
jgi:hypothetical protein